MLNEKSMAPTMYHIFLKKKKQELRKQNLTQTTTVNDYNLGLKRTNVERNIRIILIKLYQSIYGPSRMIIVNKKLKRRKDDRKRKEKTKLLFD